MFTRRRGDAEKNLELDDITGAVVDASIRVHRGLGPGLMESVYELVLGRALERDGLRVDRQFPISFTFDGMHFDHAFRIDLLVEQCVAVELKCVDRLAPVHRQQLLSYLRLANLRVGLVLNFGAGMMKEGVKRVVNDLDPSASPRLRVNNRR